MFSRQQPGVIECDEGFSVQVLGRMEITLLEQQRILTKP